MAGVMMKLITFLVLATGVLLICDGMWIRVKALIAQRLLQSAWEETVRTGVSVKPWPWADSWPVARLRVERLGVDHIVLEGDSGEALAFGPGRVSDSAKVGSRAGNCVLAGHRDTSFTFLEDLLPGDRIQLEAIDGSEHTFIVETSEIRDRSHLYLKRTTNPWLTMITCYPFRGIRPDTEQRFIVFARFAGAT